MNKDDSVLVVDDDRAMALMLVDLLQESGLAATAAYGVEEALERLEEDRFVLIVSDLQMHPLGGIELLELLTERGVETPVILMSAFPTPQVRHRALAKGARAFLSKPFEPTELLDLVAGFSSAAADPPSEQAR